MTRKVKGNASCWLTRKTMKIPPQNHSLGNIPIVIVPDFLPVRCVPTKNSSPQPPNSSLACGQNSRARGIDGWVERSVEPCQIRTRRWWFFFAKNWRCSWKQSWRDARRPRIRHAAFRASNPPGYYYYAYERRAGQSSFEFASAAADSSRMQLHSNYPCAKIKDGRDKVNS